MKFKLINFIILLVMMNGVISALSKCSGITLPVSPISFIIILSIPYIIYLFLLAVQKKYVKDYINILFFVVFFIMTFKLMFFAMDLSFSSITFTYLYYVFPLFYFYIGTSLSKVEIDKTIKNIFYAGLVLLSISFVQYLFFESLPSCLTDLPFLSSVDQDKYMREYLDIVFYRPNGLVSNPITFGYFLLILLAITLYYFNKYNKMKYLLIVLAISFMIFSLLSRTNILNMIMLFSLFAYYRFGLSITIISSMLTILILLIAIPILYEMNPLVTFVIDRFTEKDTYAAASTQEHLDDFKAAIDSITNNFLFGIPEGVYVGEDQIITDGAWLSLVLHFGIFAFVAYILIWMLLAFSSYLLSKEGEYKGLFFSIFFITIIENFFNSAMLDKGMHVFIWILFGLAYRLSQISLKGKYHE